MPTLTLNDREALELLDIVSMFAENVEASGVLEDDEEDRDEAAIELMNYGLARRLADELGEWIASKAVMS